MFGNDNSPSAKTAQPCYPFQVLNSFLKLFSHHKILCFYGLFIF